MIKLAKANVAPAKARKNSEANHLGNEDRAVHDWYRFVLSFPPHLVRQYLERFRLNENHLVLDPFCGTGTTVVECRKQGIPSVGIEAHPMACFASQVKVDWSPDPEGLVSHATAIAEKTRATLARQGIEDDDSLPLLTPRRKLRTALRTLPDETGRLLLTDSISPLPLHKTLVLLECIKKVHNDSYLRHEMLALAKALVDSISNLHFGPEVGVGPLKEDAPVVAPWLNAVRAMADDLRALQGRIWTSAAVHQADSRQLPRELLDTKTVEAVITSPPYPNEKDYTRTTRLESVLLGFIHTKADLRALKRGLLRSNTRNVYKTDDDDRLVASNPEVQRIASAIESRRLELGKTSGFERLYARVTRLYFGGMTRHLAELRPALRRGARLAYVVGDQASYLRVMIRTGQLLADIALSLGYTVDGIDLFRTRLATATKEQLREEVVLLRWPG